MGIEGDVGHVFGWWWWVNITKYYFIVPVVIHVASSHGEADKGVKCCP